MPRILIVGSGSFIGTNFLKYSRYNETDQISLLSVSPDEIEFAKYDVVLHLAAIVHQSKKITEQEYYLVNRDLCLRVAINAKKSGVSQFIFMSTLKVYGNTYCEPELRNENSKCTPDDSYGKSKYEAELRLQELEEDTFRVSIIRTPLVYGFGVKANMLSLIKLVDNFKILPFAGIENKRNFTYVENLVSYIDRIIELNISGIFIAMDDKALSTTELVLLISGHLNKKIFLFKLPSLIVKAGLRFYPSVFDRLFNSLEVENSQTKKVLNFNPPFSVQEGINRTINSYKKSIKS